MTTSLLILGAMAPVAADAREPIVIYDVPFHAVVDYATADSDSTPRTFGEPTVWFTYTPSKDMTLIAHELTAGFSHISIYAGFPSETSLIHCTEQPPIYFNAEAGQLLYFGVVAVDEDAVDAAFVLQEQQAIEVATTRLRVSLNRAGRATFRSALTCDRSGLVRLNAKVRQRQRHRIAVAKLFDVVDCGEAPMRWRSRADTQTAPLRRGWARVTLRPNACDVFHVNCEGDRCSHQRLMLRRPRRT